MGMKVAAVKSALFRLRSRFRELLRAFVAPTVFAPHEVDVELRYLHQILRVECREFSRLEGSPPIIFEKNAPGANPRAGNKEEKRWEHSRELAAD